MNELNSIETNSNLNAIPLNGRTKFNLNEIHKIKDYFNTEIQERKTMHCCIRKYIAAFYYIDKTCFICNICRNKYYFFYKYYWNSCRNSKCKFYFNIFFNYRTNKKVIESNKEKKKKHNKIVTLAN